MSNILVCDKCGYSCGNPDKFFRIKAFRKNDMNIPPIVKNMDVCESCYKEIYEEDSNTLKTDHIKDVNIGVLELLSNMYGFTYEINDGRVTSVNF